MKQKQDRKIHRQTLGLYFDAAKKHKAPFIFMLLGLIVVNAARFGSVFILAQIIDKLTTNDIAPDQIWQTFGPYIIAYMGALIVRLVVSNLSIYFFWRAQLKVSYDLANKSYKVLAYQSSQFHNDRFSGSLVSQANKFTQGFERMADALIFNIWDTVLVIAFTLIILTPLVPIYALCLVIFTVFFIVISYRYFSKLRPLNEKLAAAQNKQSGQLSDSISNIATVKSYAGEKFETRRFKKYSTKVKESGYNLAKTVMIRSTIFGGFGLGVEVIVLIFAVGSSTWFGISVGTLVMMINYTMSLLAALWGFDRVFRTINSALGDAREMTLIFNEKNEVADLEGARPLKVKKGEINFNDVTFTHTEDTDALFGDFNLTIEAGQRLGVVGRSGAGKSTLVKLILRFANIDSGEILIDGQNIANVTLDSLHKNIAYVPQETTLFHRTISENIAYGKPGASNEEIIKAAKLANAWDFIKDLPDGLETLTGERGVKLSGGQRQRIAIARAILKDAPILIMDEATASLDTESEKLIQEAMLRLMKDRTSIVIAHRLSTVADLDRIIVLDNGKIVEDGSHEELLKKSKGIYAKLWHRQANVI